MSNVSMIDGHDDAVMQGDLISRSALLEKNKKILDVTCGSRSIWFNKNHPNAVYCDRRKEQWEGRFGNALRKDGTKNQRHLVIDPDVQCDFTNLPFADASFSLVVFDPPHIEGLSDNSWTKKAYGSLDENWEKIIHDGFQECMRVLKPNGTLVFKWSETQIPTPKVIKVLGHQPLFGHRSGKKMNTNWLCFMKLEDTDAPAVDAVEVVRCKDCRYYEIHKPRVLENCERKGYLIPMAPDDFCSYGERRVDDE